MAESNVVLARAKLAHSLKLASADLLIATHEISKPGAVDMATIGAVIDRAEELLALARVQAADYKQSVEVASIMMGNNANRLLTDWLAGRADG